MLIAAPHSIWITLVDDCGVEENARC